MDPVTLKLLRGARVGDLSLLEWLRATVEEHSTEETQVSYTVWIPSKP